MRPLRFMFLVACFIAIPILLTCISVLRRPTSGGAEVFGNPQRSRLRALFSFSTPSTLFPPTALISLTAENSTFFLARPAAFGPSLPSKGLTGQLWIGKGFGDDRILSEDDLKISGFELGCSDVPGWGDDQKNTPDNPAQSQKTVSPPKNRLETVRRQADSQIALELDAAEGVTVDGVPVADETDGTDDHLHRPLPDSNPAPIVKPGESANAREASKQQSPQKPTHADIESLQESADIAGKVVMLSRGGCGFLEKVKWAQRRGGIALIVGDNERNGPLTIMYAKGDTSNITIPAIFTSYTSAHLLSTLVPPDSEIVANVDTKKSKNSLAGNQDAVKGNRADEHQKGPIFTTTQTSTSAHPSKTGIDVVPHNSGQGWMQNVLQAVGLDDDGPVHGEDSRRPPGSGNIEWVQVKDWDEDLVRMTSTGTHSSTSSRATSTTSKTLKRQTTSAVGNDDFVIGVQDWRDTELIAPKSTSTGQQSNTKVDAASSPTANVGKETQFRGGSIIPGSGEYQKVDKSNKLHQPDSLKEHVSSTHDKSSFSHKITSWFSNAESSEDETDTSKRQSGGKDSNAPRKHHGDHRGDGDQDREGLWVTLTPASVSTSPFFDTLLVLVVSPLVTLTFVYGLLLLRSRIRRRRWRAPKSVVDRLPTRIYHPMSSSASTSSSSQLPTPDRSQAGSPQPSTDPVRVRQRSQTTAGVLSASTSPAKLTAEEKFRRSFPKKYRGRQVECVVCLEEYVDGESLVMSLPCGHEFHAECITPWLVNRRRTCPICKGDVVRSLQKAALSGEVDDNLEPGDEDADAVQDRVATTVPDDTSTASIPIPERSDLPNIMDEDVERGEAEVSSSATRSANETEHEQNRPIAARWRGIINSSLSNLSGDTLWRANSVDRNR